ncbi:MAG TPA: helicase C-terminal domain-containing protein, partial [Myxococcaceae bacterium]|nr:helicase C-terminal domain-containing protein [Myxococcaceae bacterium]
RSQELGEALGELCEEAGDYGPDGEGLGLERRLDDAARESELWPKVKRLLTELHAQVEGLAKKLSVEVKESFPDFAEKGGAALDRELAGAVAELQEHSALLAELLEEPPHPSRCYSALVRVDRGTWTLTAQPVDVSGFFKEQLAKSKRALVLTSATLTAGERSPWVLERLGMKPDLTGARAKAKAEAAKAEPAISDAARAEAATGEAEKKEELVPRFLRARTPFDLPRQALVILVTDAPKPRDEAAFVDWAAHKISGLAQFMGGRVLGLFASSRRLERVGEKVRATLEPMGIEVLRQSRGHGRTLAARQEQDAGSVLLGTRSFWQGVDIPGLGVGLVFIDKLPIEPQSRPIVAAREERYAGTGKGFLGFAKYRLPRALLMLRQGVGRLIRSHQDRGIVVIADPGHPSYRGEVLAALEGYRVEALPWDQARVRIFHALKAMGLEAKSRVRPAPRSDAGGPNAA